jgi:hypothetical protein
MSDHKLHVAVARSAFGSQNAQSARDCGVKHIWRFNRSKHLMVGALLEVEMPKKCTRLYFEESTPMLKKVEMFKKCTHLSFGSQKC